MIDKTVIEQWVINTHRVRSITHRKLCWWFRFYF